ncbi:murein biosynthesis integral membrane protein MurJ [Nonomuraea soli]|uniref:Putative peptidoglycan lipid II flippase n=1 Tax=Nonomuraea soli TaxID=1032476 RepID=A0A7W0HUB5_9ACTN|nr:lipid II flippase MurJ [Nonomuraea soli]MBA2895930.1 putative peptidoglycan lipid II flippase [Nonomuraea soli]
MSGRAVKTVAGAALLIAAITMVARVIGFGRYLVQSVTLENGCLNSAYSTANYVPNIVFELVAGGALAGMVVPVLSAAAADPARKDETGRIASALLTWVTLVLLPLTVAVAVFAEPIVRLLTPSGMQGCDSAQVIAVGADMLLVFAPRMLFFGLAVVLYGVLQAHRRFLGPALAPLVSSLLIIGSYLAFLPVSNGAQDDLSALTEAGELVLSVGATIAAAAMVVTVLGPVARLRLRWRPTLSFPPGVAAEARRLGLAGLAVLIAQQVTLIVAIRLANSAVGAVPVYNYAWALLQLPYAVLAVPIGTSAFPSLSTKAANGEKQGFDALSASTTRAVLLLSGLAAGVMAAVAIPTARVFLEGRSGAEPEMMAWAVALFAPGLIGYCLLFHLGRVLYSSGHGRAAATATVTGWMVTLVSQPALVAVMDSPQLVVGALALGSTLGMSVGGVLIGLAVRRAHGSRALAGLGRALAAAVAGAVVAFLAGTALAWPLREAGAAASLAVAVGAAVLAGGGFLAVASVVDREDAKAALGRVLRRRGVPSGG